MARQGYRRLRGGGVVEGSAPGENGRRSDDEKRSTPLTKICFT